MQVWYLLNVERQINFIFVRLGIESKVLNSCWVHNIWDSKGMICLYLQSHYDKLLKAEFCGVFCLECVTIKHPLGGRRHYHTDVSFKYKNGQSYFK